MNRDQNTLENLNLSDKVLSDSQLAIRNYNHPQSERCKARKGQLPSKASIWPGALIYLKKDLSKLRGRELYMVIKIDKDDNNWCWIKKSVKQLPFFSFW